MQKVYLDREGICINGEHKIFLVSSLFYFRIPSEKWDARMKVLKSAGYNAIDVYFPWNYHETEPGSWNFEDNRDVDRFLSLAKENDLFVIARPGPYICSEWDGGGIPAWHYLKDFQIRQDDSAYINELSKWYGKILPIISKNQFSTNGSVIMLQIENELDFFNCINPNSYMRKLKKIVRGMGIDIPLIFCCGQDDIEKSGGYIEDLNPAFNIYSDPSYAGLEVRCANLYHAVQDRDLPFLITETNREHSYLKRLLCSGAKMVSPYNQVAGTTMDYYNGITNWGTERMPLALLASDYDFDSMVGSDGTLRKSYIEARLLGGLINSFGAELAKAVPDSTPDNSIDVDNDPRLISCLRMSNGSFFAVTNLEKRPKRVRCRFENHEFNVHLPAMYTAIIPHDIKFDDKHTLVWSNYEIGFFKKEGKALQIGLYGLGRLQLAFKQNDTAREINLEPKENEISSFEIGECTFLYGSPEAVARLSIPDIPEWSMDTQNAYETESVTKIQYARYDAEKSFKTCTIQEMEKHGQYRGAACYEVLIKNRQRVMIAGLSDIVSIYKNEECKYVMYCSGEDKIMKLEPGNYQFITEVWGHSNFDDIRIPSLRLGSLKGIRKIFEIRQEKDITDNWEFSLKYEIGKEKRNNYPMLMDVDKYNKPVSPLSALYHKTLYMPEECNEFYLHFSKANCIIDVYVDNKHAGQVCTKNPYMDITNYVQPGKHANIGMYVTRKYHSDKVGKVVLISGNRIEQCRYSDVTFAGSTFHPEGSALLPYKIEFGKEKVIVPEIPDRGADDIKLIFKGKNVLLTIASHNHIVGRILLDNSIMPSVTGGIGNEAFICKEWLLRGNVLIKCQALTRDAEINEILVKRLKETRSDQE